MKKTLYIFFIFVLGILKAQVYNTVEQMPQFPGGDNKLYEYVAQNIVYPEIAKRAGVEGKVFISFIVDENGYVNSPEILKGIGSGCDEEAKRVVSSLRFTAGRHKGKAVKVRLVLPIFFKLQE